MKISIVTPSYSQVAHLKRCTASVADQCSDLVDVEHLIQDGGSGAEFNAWASEQEFANVVSEADAGMYDAINRGFLRASGDIVAWLNCDEQYLSGTLQKVAEYFGSHPDVDILFGDVVLVNEGGVPISYRRAVKPWIGHIESCFLPTYSAATFVRRRVIDDGLFLSTEYRMISDAIWVKELLERGYKMGVIHQALSTFVQNGENMGQQDAGKREWIEWRSKRSGWLKKIMWGTLHRFCKWMSGAYKRRSVSIEIYIGDPGSREERQAFVGGRWFKG